MKMYDLLKSSVQNIKEYKPGKSIDEIVALYDVSPDSVIKLGSNENILGPSPKAIDALHSHSKTINIYPSVDAYELVCALSEYTNFPKDNIVASGPGMDGLIDNLMRLIVSKDDEVIIPIPTFIYYEISAFSNDAKPIFVERNSDFSINVDAILNAETSKTKIVFLCSPNNPSGELISEKDARKIIESVNCFVFIDEAYIEFAESNLSDLVKDYDNLIIGRTFSKVFGLASLRIGYGIMPAWLKKEYMKVSPPFSISGMGINAAVSALSDTEHVVESVELSKRGREYLKNNILFKVYESMANFVMVDTTPLNSKEVSEALLKRGIIVRDCSSIRGAGDFLIRITIGTDLQNERVVDELNKIYKEIINLKEI
ncbi:MAG: histidinol-phosphate transaminase [Methanosarcinaceae archaeon]|nr:histidinol-phosphate transaminase [Methanosarcinaceae archaeon]NKQ39314.1 histidinol-phosphate transaminase [Methanosarcinales archaeon]